MERTTRAAFALAGFATLAAVFVGIFAPGGSTPSPPMLLQRSAEVMANETFSIRPRCEFCDKPALIEYAPPDRIRLTSGSPRGDNWPFYLYSEGEAYFSETGQRWQTDAADSNGWLAGYQRMVDPRVMLGVLIEPRLTGSDVVGERQAHVVSGALDVERLMSAAPPDFRALAEGPLGELLRQATVTVWIDTEDSRLLRLRLFSPVDNVGESTLEIDFDSPVDLPASVESMDVEEARALNQQSERNAEVLLRAIGDYHRDNGTYPPEVSPTALATYLENWPVNPFSGGPVRFAPATPGNFDYSRTASGEQIQFQLDGWDGSQLFYDSARFGPIRASTR
jgi:hypothetical protein